MGATVCKSVMVVVLILLDTMSYGMQLTTVATLRKGVIMKPFPPHQLQVNKHEVLDTRIV